MDSMMRAMGVATSASPSSLSAGSSNAKIRSSSPRPLTSNGLPLLPRSTSGGILLNNSPAVRAMSPTRGAQLYSSQSAASSAQSILQLPPSVHSSPTSPVTSPSQPPRDYTNPRRQETLKATTENTRLDDASLNAPLRIATSSSIIGNMTHVDVGTAESQISTPTSIHSTKIRFAPFPEARPRSYSTGHNLFLEAGDIDEHDRAWIVRNAGERLAPGMAPLDSAIDSDDEDDGGPPSRRGSVEVPRGRTSRPSSAAGQDESIFSTDRWLMEGQIVGKATSKEREKSGLFGGSVGNKSQESITLKILRPLSFGLVKKKSRKQDSSPAPSKRPATSDGANGRGEPLSRVSSIDSDVSRGSSVSAISGTSSRRPATANGGSSHGGDRTWGSEAGGIRRTFSGDSLMTSLGGGRRNWNAQSESSPSVSSHQYAPTRRANYPPVAQRSKKKVRPTTAPANSKEPKFVEWGFKNAGLGGEGGMGNNSKSGVSVDEDEEEDGSGLAWIKRRKEERRIKAEEEEARKREDEVREAQREIGTPQILVVPESPVATTHYVPTHLYTHPEGDAPRNNRVAQLHTSPSSDSLLTNTSTTNNSSPDASLPATPIDELSENPLHFQSSASPLSASVATILGRTAPHTDAVRSASVDTVPFPSTTTALAQPMLTTKAMRRTRSLSPSRVRRESSEEDLTQKDSSGEREDDDDSDLDADEIAHEEELREKARRAALSGASEKFSSTRGSSHVVTAL